MDVRVKSTLNHINLLKNYLNKNKRNLNILVLSSR